MYVKSSLLLRASGSGSRPRDEKNMKISFTSPRWVTVWFTL
jgi:hypothetical protein